MYINLNLYIHRVINSKITFEIRKLQFYWPRVAILKTTNACLRFDRRWFNIEYNSIQNYSLVV